MRAYQVGLLTNLTNPKVMLYTTSLLAGTFLSSPSATMKILIAAEILVLTAVWFGALAYLCGTGTAHRWLSKNARSVNLVTGTVFWLFGASLIIG